MNKIKYSILIPTRNGAPYVTYAVKSVLQQSYPNCEVIVSVNHSSDNTLDLLKAFDDSRLKVIVPPSPLSMTAHFEWLLGQALGEWITIVGDDDAVMPYFFEKLEKILQKWDGVEAIVARRRAYYFWKGCESAYGNKAVIFESGEGEYLVHGQKGLLLTIAGIKSFTDLPQLYTNGIVHRSLIEKIKSKSGGKFYHEITPDVYSAMAVTSNVKHYLQVETPLFWVGSSPKSVGMAVSLNSQKKSSQESAKRAEEFEEMAKKDHVQTAKEVGLRLWRESLGCIFILSSLRSMPFPVKHFKGRWVEYLIFTQIAIEIQNLKSKGKNERAHSLESAFLEQALVLRLKLSLLFLFSIFIKTLRKCVKIRGKIRKKRPFKFSSEDKVYFHTIEVASNEVLRMLESSS